MYARAKSRIAGSAPLLGALLACAGLHGDACAADTGVRAKPATHVVVMEEVQYKPAALTVHRGDRIVWKNKDLFPHTATAQSGAFDSKSIAADASWTFVATRTGTFEYNCTFHPTMKATLTVR